ncbi:MAG: DUF4007 family protein [Deltaproteobacteria bacterium]|nr:DUF4007 family protein [Deltaproteobacteria bacterium]MBW2154743.1 DUF4007 family protein [Deltaproteobacteria bacterium]
MAEKSWTGHRQRLRERFLAGEVESRSDEMLLELLLSFSIARKDVRPLAKELIQIFGSLYQVLSTSPDELSKVKGVGPASIALLKAVDFLRSASATRETKVSLQKGVNDTQQKLFENLMDGPSPEQAMPISINKKSGKQKKSKTPATPKNIRRKFQVSNGYLLEFDQLARVLHYLLEHRDAKKINRKVLREDTGLADRQVESLVSMGAAMGLIQPGRQILTPVGLLIAEHDIFIENKGSLEWCHYAGAGSYHNLIWFEIFNRLLAEPSPMTQEKWSKQLRSDLAGQYSKRTISKSLYEEVRFVIDAYLERNFSKLELLQQLPDGRLYWRRYTGFAPLILCAMIYDFCATEKTHLFQVGEMVTTHGSPAVVFGLDEASFRQQIEALHGRGWLRYETTHNLDQIRLKPGLSAIEFLMAHFEDRPPREDSKPSPGDLFE